MAKPATTPDLPPAPVEAFRFRAAADAAQVVAAVDGKRRSFSGIAYSGELITGHYYWDRVVFDLAETTAQKRIPALIDHDRSKRAGYASLTVADGQISATGELLTNDHGKAIAQDADDGFPWQMSVHIEPARVERLEPGVRATVNGREIVGPAHIFRSNTIREVSFTPTGADGNTSVQVFSAPFATPFKEPSHVDPVTESVAELKASIDAANTQIQALTARAEAAEAALQAHQFAARTEAVKNLFSDIGREFSEADAQPYLDLPAAAFEVVARDMRTQFAALNKKDGRSLPGYLFHAQATGAPDRSDAERIAAHVNRPKV